MPQTSTAPVPALPEPSKPDFEIYGVDLNVPFGGWDADEVWNPAEAEIPDLLERLDRMIQNDGHMAALYRLVTLPLRRAKWRIEGDQGGEVEAAFIDAMFSSPPHLGGMSTSMDYIMALLAKATLMGFSVFEEVYQVVNLNGRPAVTLRKMAPREQKTIAFRADDQGGFNGVVQRAHSQRRIHEDIQIPRDKTFFWCVDKEHHPFYGRSMFLPGLYHFDRKHRLYWIAHIAAQFSAVPGRIGYVDTGADLSETQRRKFREALASFGFNTAMVPPQGTRIEPFASNNSDAAEQILSLIEHHNVQASQSVLAQFIDLGQGAGAHGSYALSNDASAMFLLGEEALLNSIAEHINWYVIPKFIDWNFGTRKYPKIVFDPISDEMRNAMVDIYRAIAASPEYRGSDEFLNQLERQISGHLGLPIDYDAIEAEKEAAKSAADKVADAINRLASTPTIAEKGSGGEPEPEDAEIIENSDRQHQIWLADMRSALARFNRHQEVARDPSEGGRDQQALVRDIQERLDALGRAPGAIDGIYGDETYEAVLAFQQFVGLPTTGKVDMGTYALLLDMTPEIVVAPDDVPA